MAGKLLCHSKVALKGLTALKPGDVLRINSNWNLLVTSVVIHTDQKNRKTFVVDGYYVLVQEINNQG